jgi:AraC-like DNA-binding protein
MQAEDQEGMRLTTEEISRRIGGRVAGHRLALRADGTGAAALEGVFGLSDGTTGIGVHATAARVCRDFEARFRRSAGALLIVLLEGELDFDIGDRSCGLSAATGPAGVLHALPRAAWITRRGRRGERVRKVVISIDRRWVAAWSDAEPSAELRRFLGRCGARTQWSPSLRAVRNAEHLVRVRDAGTPAARLGGEVAALEIVQEALALFDPGAVDGPATSREAELVAAARRHIDGCLAPGLTTGAIARAVGASERVLERAFRHCLGQTVGAYRRSLGLERARRALLEEGVGVRRAAEIAGYANPSSFATAFAREFGVPPSRAR